MARYARELAGAQQVEGDRERQLWASIREFTPAFVNDHANAHVVRVSSTLTQTAGAIVDSSTAAVSRAASGVSYLYFDGEDAARAWSARPETAGWSYVFEYGSQVSASDRGSDFEMMKSLKKLFDPEGILNPGRLYGRI